MRKILVLTAVSLLALAGGASAAAAEPGPASVKLVKERHCNGSTYNVYVNGQPLFLYPQVCPDSPT